MLYVAVPYDAPGGRVVVRAATPLSAVDALIAQLRIALGFAGLLGVLAALLMSGLASHWTSRTLRALVDGARRLADSSTTRPIELGSRDEMANIAGSVNRLAAELTRSLEDLAEERDRVRAILASMREGILALDEDGRVTLANPAALELLGLEQAPLGRSLVEVMRQPAVLDVADRTTEAPVDETEIELPGPSTRRVRVRASKRRGGEGVVLVLHDVTEMRRLEAVRSEFVANVSHELRTPLTVIAGYLETLLDNVEAVNPRWLRALQQMQQQGGRMQNLLNDLLLLAKLEATDYPSDNQPVAVDLLLLSIKNDAQALSAERHHRISLEADPHLRLKGSETELRSAFSNLVFNAVKYTPDEGEIRIRWWADEQGAHLAVADTGLGIEAKHLPRLTERFYRVDSSRASNTGGTGLGLAIVKHVLLRHRARLNIVSNPGKGSTFTCHFPAQQMVRRG